MTKLEIQKSEELLLQKLESSLKNLRIADLELFITAAYMKNLGKSAKFHNLSQSAASTAILRVESAFTMNLCTHEKRRFCLTREGEILLPKLEEWVNQLRNLVIAKEPIPIRLVTTHAIAEIAVPALLAMDKIEFKHQRPDKAYAAIVHGEADIALVLDNASWGGVIAREIGKGSFQLYAKDPNTPIKPALLPEDQMEVLALKQSFLQIRGYPLQIKTVIPSWSLIAKICKDSDEVGFLPDFLAKRYDLSPVYWQSAVSSYRVLAIYKNREDLNERLNRLILSLQKVF
jgi:DNA-binding transcriptional LysR family regulator